VNKLPDIDLMREITSIYSHQAVADAINHPREVVSRWLKETGEKQDWLTYNERIHLEGMLPKVQSHKSDFTFIDLFAGIGGIRKGFEDVGGECVFTSEWDAYANKTYRANFYLSHPIQGDIREITQPNLKTKKAINNHIDRNIPDHDVLLAGFPCQPFSIAGVSKKNSLGRAHGFECETQGTLFFDVAKIIEVKKPSAVMLENVKNLKSHDKGNTFKVILNTLDELGYDVVDKEYTSNIDPKIINAKLFVPQNRERIVIVAFKKELKLAQQMTLKKVKTIAPKNVPIVGDILQSTKDVGEKYVLSDKLWAYLKGYAEKHKSAGNGFGYGLVNTKSLSTRTLSARYYKDGSEILVSRGKSKNPRRLTPLECSRLMGFNGVNEDKFIIPVSDTQAYKQFGNSVAVPVFKAVASLMKPLIVKAKELSS